MKKLLVLFVSIGMSSMANAGTWCTFSNFNVVVAGDCVAVHGSSLDSDGKHVLLGDIRTEKGRAIHSLLLTAAIAGKPVTYGHNGQDYTCGNLPAYNTVTANPQYIHIVTKN